MALTDDGGNNGMVMPVAPLGNYGGGYGGFGGDWGSWIILFLIFGMFNGGGFGMGGWGGFGNMALGYDFPWLLNGQQNINANTNAGFRDAMLNDGITSIRDGISGLSTQLCGCCGDMQMALANGFANAETAANARQMANMQTNFAMQNAVNQGFNGIQGSLCNGFNGTQVGLADLKYTVATENCADRQALNEGVRDIIANQTAGVQRVLDKLCDQELQAERRENQNLRSELMYARGQASQVEQTAQLRASQATTANQLVSELRSCPIPSQPVYGNQPIFTCGNSGCGCNNGFYN